MPTLQNTLIETLKEYRIERDYTWWQLTARIDAAQPRGIPPMRANTLRTICNRGLATDRNLRKIERFIESIKDEVEVRA